MSARPDIIRTAARDVIKAYKKLAPMRTADFHSSDCGCLRCAVDNLEAALAHEAGDDQ